MTRFVIPGGGTRFVIAAGGTRFVFVIAAVAFVSLAACEDKKPDTTTPPTGSATSTTTSIADDAIPVSADFEAETESITPENVEAEVAKLEAELGAD